MSKTLIIGDKYLFNESILDCLNKEYFEILNLDKNVSMDVNEIKNAFCEYNPEIMIFNSYNLIESEVVNILKILIEVNPSLNNENSNLYPMFIVNKNFNYEYVFNELGEDICVIFPIEESRKQLYKICKEMIDFANKSSLSEIKGNETFFKVIFAVALVIIIAFSLSFDVNEIENFSIIFKGISVIIGVFCVISVIYFKIKSCK